MSLALECPHYSFLLPKTKATTRKHDVRPDIAQAFCSACSEKAWARLQIFQGGETIDLDEVAVDSILHLKNRLWLSHKHLP